MAKLFVIIWVLTTIAKVGSKFCQAKNKPSKVCLEFLIVCTSGEILPNMVTLVITLTAAGRYYFSWLSRSGDLEEEQEEEDPSAGATHRRIAAWPDWAIFESSWWQISLQKKPKYLMNFGLFTKHHFWTKNYYCYFLGKFWKKLGYFYFQHLVTPTNSKKRLI